MTSAKVKINIGSNYFEIEGSEQFVNQYIEEFKHLISNGRAPESSKRKSNGSSKQKAVSPIEIKEPKTPRPKRAKKVIAERFDIHGGNGKPSLKDFLDEKKPGTANGPRIAVIGYYITEILGNQTFSEGQVEYAYKMLGIKRPNHLHQIMINNKNEKDYYEPIEGDESNWQLTRSGEIFVADELPENQS